MRHSEHQLDVRKRLLKILKTNVEGEHLNSTDFEFVMSVLKHHPHFKEKAGSGVNAITTQTVVVPWQNGSVKKYMLITEDGQLNSISHKKAMSWESAQFILIKKLTYFAKRMQKKLIFEFREGDTICNKTWKKIVPGWEKVIYNNNNSLRQLCISYLRELDEGCKQILLDNEVQLVPNFIRVNWLHFLEKQTPIVVHTDYQIN